MTEFWQRACEVVPGGVSAPSRSFGAVDGEPIVADHGEGSTLFSTDGKRYVDYYMSQGSLVLGHAHRAVVEAIVAASSHGTSFGLTTESEIEFAEELRSRVSGVEMVRFVTTGSDATSVAVRIARSATGRKKVMRFSGGYHGNSDVMLRDVSQSGAAPVSSGLALKSDDIYVPYNTVPELNDEVAAVIVEPIACNMGVIAPADGFLQALRDACTKNDSVLIFDEVITGFRVARGGASELLGVTPDLWCFGKIIGGGLPLAAVAGTRALMEELSPVGHVYAAGTMAANPVAIAAGQATLNLLDESAYEMLRGRARELSVNLLKVAETASVKIQVPVVSALVGMFFAEEPVTNEVEAQASADSKVFAKFFNAMLKRGVLLAPTPFSPVYISLAHSWEDIDWTTDIASAALAEIS